MDKADKTDKAVKWFLITLCSLFLIIMLVLPLIYVVTLQ